MLTNSAFLQLHRYNSEKEFSYTSISIGMHCISTRGLSVWLCWQQSGVLLTQNSHALQFTCKAEHWITLWMQKQEIVFITAVYAFMESYLYMWDTGSQQSRDLSCLTYLCICSVACLLPSHLGISLRDVSGCKKGLFCVYSSLFSSKC